MTIHEIFNSIEHAAGINEKMAIMQQNLNDTIKLIYEDCYDTNRKYGVHKFTPNGVGPLTIDKDYHEFNILLDALAKRIYTGNDAIERVETLIGEFVPDDQPILTSILNKKLTIGLSKKSFNKLTGVTAKKEFEVTLALKLEDVKGVNPVDGSWYASRKCDGVRTVAKIVKKGSDVKVSFISRQGKPIETLDNCIPALQWLVRNEPDDTYYADGEGCIVDAKGNEDFQSILKEIRRKNHTIAKPCYQLFDFVTEDEFLGYKTSNTFTDRYNHMQLMIQGNKFDTLKVLHQELLKSQADFNRWEGYVSAGNWEGFMLRKDEEFKTGRLKTLLKVKKFIDDEYEVVGVETGVMTTQEPGMGNVKYEGIKSLEIIHKGNKVNVGSGLTKDQRIEWFNDPSKIVGKTITVKYFEETQDQTGAFSLRFPVLKAVYENGRTV